MVRGSNPRAGTKSEFGFSSRRYVTAAADTQMYCQASMCFKEMESARNKMPARRIELRAVTALDAFADANAHDREHGVQEATFRGPRVEITEAPTHE